MSFSRNETETGLLVVQNYPPLKTCVTLLNEKYDEEGYELLSN